MLRKLRKALAERMLAIGDTFECCTWYRDNWTADRIIVRTATMEADGRTAAPRGSQQSSLMAATRGRAAVTNAGGDVDV